MDAGRLIHRYLDKQEAEAFGAAIDALRQRIRSDLGASDIAHIQRIMRLQRRLEVGGRVGIHIGVVNPLLWLAGVGALGVSKILENMEIGHNIMHGQYDWTGLPGLESARYEWDLLAPAEQWRHVHNVVHHRFTNIVGHDRDVGYGALRMAPTQPWHPRFLAQPLVAVGLFLTFEWGVGVHDLELEKILEGRWRWREHGAAVKVFLRKAVRQIGKDYVVFPLLAGPFFLPVMLGNFAANLMRNMWTFAIIFCGHFPEGVQYFTEEECRDETRSEWYVRQLLGSCNISGQRWLHVLSGHLTHQIEHHLFPSIPAHRYVEMAPEVQSLCARFGLPYNTGSFSRQFSTVVKRIFRFSLPGPMVAPAG